MKIVAILASLAVATSAFAVDVLPLWPGQPPGSIGDAAYKEETILRDNDPSKPRTAKVVAPTLDVYLAAKDKTTGTAVVICPGGGYGFLAVDHEGAQVAKWLNDLGISAFVLKYRLPSDVIMKDKSVGPLQDVQEAIRTVRRRATDWGVNPQRIGVMGFSAGGHLAASASTLYADNVYPSDGTSARPDFSILVYPVISMELSLTHLGSRNNLLGKDPSEALVKHFSLDQQVNPDTPPAFLIHSEDDGTVRIENSVQYFLALKNARVPAEFHAYPVGGHGYGLGQAPGKPGQWPDALKAWLKSRSLLEAAK